jgi:hypothetical protein
MELYAVVIRDYKVVFVEFYWADDADHAMDQAINAHPTSRHEAVAKVPYVPSRKPQEVPPQYGVS